MYIHDFFQNFLKTFLVCFYGAFTSSVIAPDIPPSFLLPSPFSLSLPSRRRAARWLFSGCGHGVGRGGIVRARGVRGRPRPVDSARFRRSAWPVHFFIALLRRDTTRRRGLRLGCAGQRPPRGVPSFHSGQAGKWPPPPGAGSSARQFGSVR